MSISPSLTVTAVTAAKVLGLSRRQFDRLVKADVLPSCAPRQFDLAALVPAYVTYVEQGREGASTIAEAKLQTERERGRKLAFENSIRVGEVVYVNQITDLLAELGSSLVQLTEAIPGRHADELAAIPDSATTRQRLLAILRAMRAQYADRIDEIANRLAGAR